MTLPKLLYLSIALASIYLGNASSTGRLATTPSMSSSHASEEATVSDPYDYIICGGGTAGCVLAERLSADGTKRVLVLEAGRPDYEHLFIRIPAGVLRLFRSVYDWQYESCGEKVCNGRNIFFQRGKVLGGSSCTNVCLYHRGSAQDYNDWDVPGWTAIDVLPFFKRSQKDVTGRSPEFHGKEGLWVMDEVRYQNPLSQRFLEVGVAAGLGANSDFNDWSKPQDGVGRFQVSETNGERCSAASSFLKLCHRRKNIKIRTGVMCRKINFDSDKTAIGVTYDIVGEDISKPFKATLKEGGEVIVTSGSVASPQLLMCSGIGPRDHLEDMGIPIISDLPGVGGNLQDHPAAVVSFRCPVKGVSVTSKLRLFGMQNPIPVLQWLFCKTGLLTSTGCDHGAFVRTLASNDGQADLQIRFLAAKALSPDGMSTFTQFRSNRGNHEDGYSFQSVAIRAKSQGRIRLASSNTHVPPIIDAGYLSNPSDLATLREGIKLGRLLGRRPEWGEYLGEEVYPGPLVQTDEEIDEYIRNSVHTANAMTGTCKMGLHRDCVVGTDLKVFGVNRVRVCDSSIIPIIPGGQTATPTVMIAERAAAMIIADAIPMDTSSTFDHATIQAEDGPEQSDEGHSDEVDVTEEIESIPFTSEQSDDLEQDATTDSLGMEVETTPFVNGVVTEESHPDLNVEAEVSENGQKDAISFQFSDGASTSTENDNTAESTDLASTSPSE